MAECIRLRDVRMAYGDKPIFSALNLTFDMPGAYAILGPSGEGKTTLLRLIAGLARPLSGDITLPRDARIAFCFQEDRLLPFKTALENVALACRDREAARHWLARVGLGAEADAYPASLSGGMQRRVALARALAFDAPIVLLDEPFRALDAETHARMRALVRESCANKLLLLVTHDEADAHGMHAVTI